MTALILKFIGAFILLFALVVDYFDHRNDGRPWTTTAMKAVGVATVFVGLGLELIRVAS